MLRRHRLYLALMTIILCIFLFFSVALIYVSNFTVFAAPPAPSTPATISISSTIL